MSGILREAERDLGLKDLGAFIGTENYYKVFGALITDGVKYLIDNGYSWFVTDSLAVLKFNPKLKEAEFLAVKLKLDRDKEEADILIDDGNYNVLYKQHYSFTDAKKELTLFFTDNVLMLAGEY